MSSTQASQTLFRFVSVRNPQLTDESGKEKRFVYRSQEVKNQAATINVFDAAIIAASTVPKLQLLKDAAVAFKTSAAHLVKEEDVKLLVGAGMYDFSIWLARNRDSYINSELLTKASEAGSVLNTNVATRLWNNLFYQVVTQESFYVKESIMQVLIANHIIANVDHDIASKGIANNQTIAIATVILPKELFLEDVVLGTGIGNKAGLPEKATAAKKNILSTNLRNKQVAINAQHYNNVYKELKSTVTQIEANYQKQYQTDYEKAYKAYQEKVKPIVDKYRADIEVERVKWVNAYKTAKSHPLHDNPYNHPATLPEPTLPAFDFKSKSSNIEYLQEKLPQTSIKLINSLLINNFSKESSKVLDGKTINVDNIDTIFENIDAAISKNNDAIIANTTNEVGGFLAVGGVSIPLSSNASRASTCENFVATTSSFHTATDWFMRIMFDATDIYIANATYEVYDMSGNLCQADTYFDSIGGDYYTIFSSQNLLQIIPQIENGFVLKGSFTLTDGDIYHFDITLMPNYVNGIDPLTGLYNLIGNGAMCKDTIPPPTGGGDPTIAFKPSGFGVKQLGIADYKKVEQTVHCYVEGEVAHIENIMAREYREKSTRRLRRSENTTTTSSESEREHLSDTTSTDRFEMQNEVAKVMQQTRDFSANASVSATKFGITLNAGANYATHNSKEESTRAAVTEAKDITERAMERVVSRVKQERIEKIVEEFEENNKHGFDNTKGDKHVVGVYRWVDKIYKNQIYNYGKRLMFEFMIPEPAKLHYLGMIASKDSASGKVIVKPIDPRKAKQMKIETSSALAVNEARYWASVFNVDIDSKLDDTIQVSFSFNNLRIGTDYEGFGRFSGAYSTDDFKIPDDYEAVYVKGVIHGGVGTYWHGPMNRVCWGHISGNYVGDGGAINLGLNNIRKNISISFHSWDVKVIAGSLTATCNLTNEAKQMWQQKTFKAIIDGYNKALAQYEDDLAQEAANASNVLGTNPGFYREIENMILRKNCISYLIDQSPSAKLTYGRQMFKTAGAEDFDKYEVNVTKDLDNYTAFAKFLEQAFEWNIMSYYFYPFYWGAKADWGTLYQYDNNDPIFRSFMQSGLARVVVTVRPGFEDAVRFYMQTGLVWNGGEVPVIDDPLHLSIVDELKEATGKPEGKAWATRVPTSLTILQADSIGLKVEKALPCNCDDVTADTWENPSAVPCGDNFVVTHDVLNSGDVNKSLVQFSFVEIDAIDYNTIRKFDEQKKFPIKFKCMEQEIFVQRDAAWLEYNSSAVIFEELARQLSFIAGIKAVQYTAEDGNHNGILFTVDTSIIPAFKFEKFTNSEGDDILKLFFTADSVRLTDPTHYTIRVLDKSATRLNQSELNTLLPISRFKV